jgi:5,10-methylenetetrahydrofolate reductase
VTEIRQSIADAFAHQPFVVAAELRPPRAELGAAAGMDAWIDTYHAVRALTRRDLFVCLTDSAVGSQEEDNLRHLVTNLGTDADRGRVVPFLTTKHSLDYCINYADRAHQHGFPALVVLGGDQSIGPARCVGHAWELRQAIRHRQPALSLGGWANPHADATRQIDYLLDPCANADFYLTQVVSHHVQPKVGRFLREARTRGLQLPGLFGVFYYRSANPRTLTLLRDFMPVPTDALAAEFASGADPIEICARTVRALVEEGVRGVYISNLPLARAYSTLSAILDRAGVGMNLIQR